MLTDVRLAGGWLIETQTATRNRVLKLLEGANIKLSGVASDVFGVSGMAMLEALAAGTSNASEMAGLARGRMRRKHAALEAAPEVSTYQLVSGGGRRLMERLLSPYDPVTVDMRGLLREAQAALEQGGDKPLPFNVVPHIAAHPLPLRFSQQSKLPRGHSRLA